MHSRRFVAFAQVLAAQEGTSAYQYLKIPVSSHVAATGGQNISIVDDDATLGMSNPALLSNVSDGMLSLTIPVIWPEQI